MRASLVVFWVLGSKTANFQDVGKEVFLRIVVYVCDKQDTFRGRWRRILGVKKLWSVLKVCIRIL